MKEYAMGILKSKDTSKSGFYIFQVKEVGTKSWKVESIIVQPENFNFERILYEVWDFSNSLRSLGKKDLIKNLFLYYNKL